MFRGVNKIREGEEVSGRRKMVYLLDQSLGGSGHSEACWGGSSYDVQSELI